MTKFIFNEKQNERLDKFLLSRLPQYSRAFIKEQIKSGLVLINKKTTKPSYELKEGDEVLFALPDQPDAKLAPNPDIKLNVIFEDNDVLVINKPAGLSVHPRMNKSLRPVPTETKNTLVSGLLAYCPAIANVGDINPPQPSLKGGSNSPPLEPVLNSIQEGVGGDFSFSNIRPGLVHRLDKDTSGVMIIAKNQTAFEWLKKQFKTHQAAKKYLALVHGHLKKKEGQIKCFLKRSPDPTKQQVVFYKSLLPSDEGRVGRGDEKNTNTTPSFSPPQLRGRGKAREAISDYQVIKEFKDYSLIEVKPQTGRFHQIRAQFAWLGHPVVGDQKYGPAKLAPSRAQRGGKNTVALPNVSRQFLHAQELAITLPNGQKKTFNASLPDDLEAALEALENK